MKATRPASTDAISQAVAKGHCPICSLLTEFQEKFIEGTRITEVSILCNFHAWAVAKAAPADLAAQLFHRMVEKSGNPAVPGEELSCDLCKQIREQDRTRTNEMMLQLKTTSIRQWTKLQGSFCLAHAEKLVDALPSELSGMVGEIMNRNRKELLEELSALRVRLKRGDRTGWGSLGRAAEFLASQRGILR
jgi:hypothetical protein